MSIEFVKSPDSIQHNEGPTLDTLIAALTRRKASLPGTAPVEVFLDGERLYLTSLGEGKIVDAPHVPRTLVLGIERG